MKYFAYGSNMSSQRLEKRGIKASFTGGFFLARHVLKFHKKSKDGSGKCNASYTNKDSDKVYGALYEINRSDEETLDKYEGLGRDYDKKYIDVENNEGVIEKAYTYCANPDCINNELMPCACYKNHVLTGAEECGLPPEYIEKIRTLQTKECNSK